MVLRNFIPIHLISTFFQVVIIIHKADTADVGNETKFAHNDEVVNTPDSCQEFNTCNYSRNVYIPNCYCDSSCQAYGDCCFDYKISDTISEDEEIKEVEQSFSHRLQCEELFGNNFGVFLISDCRNGSHVEATVGSIEDKIPVTGTNSIVYKNINIAKCNNQQEFKVWDVSFLFQVCAGKVHFDLLKGMPNIEMANALFNIGCEFRVIPPSGSIPRFCMNIFRNKTVCNSQRFPIFSSTTSRAYQNSECCGQFEEQCSICAKSDIYFDKQLNFRLGTSMAAIFQIQFHNRYQKRHSTYSETTSTEVTFQNFLFEKMVIASSIDEHDEMELSRALLFLESCTRNANNLGALLMKYRISFTSLKENESIGGLLLSFVDVIIVNDKNPHEILDIKQWIERVNVTYTEETEEGNITFHIRFLPRSEKSFYTKSKEFKIIYIDPIHTERNNVEFLNYLYNHDFPKRSCAEIYGHVNRQEHRRSVFITCKNDKATNSRYSNVATVVHRMSTICLDFLSFIIISEVDNGYIMLIQYIAIYRIL